MFDLIGVEEVLRMLISGLIFGCCVFVANLVVHAVCGGKDS